MFKASSPPGDLPPGWTASEFDRYKDYMGDNWLPPPDIGHNGPPQANPNPDPGPDHSYRISFEIPDYVSRESIAVFELALRGQGDHKHRLAALDQAAYRARADGQISAAAYRVYEVVRAASKGRHRCCLWDLDKIGFFAGGIDRARASKLLAELEAAKLIVMLKFTEGKLGAPSARKLFIAPAVTAEDRMESTSERIEADAETAKVAALQKRADAARKLYQRRSGGESLVSPETTRNSSFTGDNEKENGSFLVVKNEFSSFTGDNTLKHNSNSRSLSLPENDATATLLVGEGAGAPDHIADATNRSTPSDRSSLPDQSTLIPELALQTASASSKGAAIDLQFEEFWKAFPTGRKQAKGDALDLFRQIVTGKHKKRRASASAIIDAVKRYAATNPDPKYAPMPTTWLNGGRWMDDLSEQTKKGSKYDAI